TRERFAYVDGTVAENGGLCKGLTVKVQGVKMEIRLDFFVVDLGEGADIVLGADWVSRLLVGGISWNSGLKMEVEVAGKKITLKGDPSLNKGIEIWTIHRIID
ncbi:hypothetical protein PIB30_114259, partial [Stylosanthes scabra]|nr:hypothetical protein [Stylosanthes scabra]